LPSPPSSPPLAALTSANELALTPKITSRKRDKDGKRKSRREGAAYVIREECERLFCEIMKSVFLGERDADDSGSIAMETFHYSSDHNTNRVSSWLEVWDYAGGCSFRGFVANTGTEKCLFTFFNSDVVGRDLKAG
jgi:Ornithine decarboxylase antizyme